MIIHCMAVLAGAAYIVDLQTYGDNGVRVRVVPPGAKLQEPVDPAILPGKGNPVNGTMAQSGNLMVTADPTTGYIQAQRVSDNKILLQTKSLAFSAAPNNSAGMVGATVSFSSPIATNATRLYGLGQHYDHDKVNLFPFTRVFADSIYYRKSHGSDVSIPWFCTSDGVGFVWNTGALGGVNISDWSNVTWWGVAVHTIDFWIVTTPDSTKAGDFNPLLRQLADAIGHSTPMPFWTTGFIQSKDRYRNQSQLLDVARGYASRGIPVSVIVVDWQHWVHMGDYAFNPACWPDPQSMVDELRGLGMELLVSTWPYIQMGSSINWGQFSSQGWLALNASTGKADNFYQGNALVDPTNPDAMKGVMQAWWKGYGQYGIKAVWMDSSEPDHSNYIAGGQWNFHAASDGAMLAGWVKYWAEGFRQGLIDMGHEEGDFFILSRYGWSGTGNAAALWSGDITSTWDSLQRSVKAAQQVAMSGIPLWTTDIGGYVGGNPEDPAFREMLVRWFQFGAFCPLFRLHGHRVGGPPSNQCGPTNGPNEVYDILEGEQYNAVLAVMNLRETLRQYVKDLNNHTVVTGEPMLRPMFLNYPEDVNTASAKMEGQFMLGPDWLIAPVTSSNATQWQVYLPVVSPSHEWVYFWNQTATNQIGWVTFSISSIADFPLYFRRPVESA